MAEEFSKQGKHKNAYIWKTLLDGEISTKFLTHRVSLRSSYPIFKKILSETALPPPPALRFLFLITLSPLGGFFSNLVGVCSSLGEFFPPPRRLCFRLGPPVCLFVNKITQKPMDGF